MHKSNSLFVPDRSELSLVSLFLLALIFMCWRMDTHYQPTNIQGMSLSLTPTEILFIGAMVYIAMSIYTRVFNSLPPLGILLSF